VSIGTFASIGYIFRNEPLTEQVVALSVATLVSSVIVLLAYAIPVGRLIHISPRTMGSVLFPTVLASTAGFLVLLATHEVLSGAPLLVRMGIEGTAAVAVMAVILLRYEPRAREGADKLRALRTSRR
jgi:heme A synthase